jgi:hypothetical protein
MARKLPSLEEFEVTENKVLHKPTNATWIAHDGDPEPSSYRPSMLGSVLPNGDDYRDHEVKQIALRLLRERLNK